MALRCQYHKLTGSFPLNEVCSYSPWLLTSRISTGEPPKKTTTTTETICITEQLENPNLGVGSKVVKSQSQTLPVLFQGFSAGLRTSCDVPTNCRHCCQGCPVIQAKPIPHSKELPALGYLHYQQLLTSNHSITNHQLITTEYKSSLKAHPGN